jgi:hypothetical protein
MAATNRNYDLQNQYKYLLNFPIFDSLVSNLLSAENNSFHLKYLFCSPINLLPGAAATTPPPPSSYTPALESRGFE